MIIHDHFRVMVADLGTGRGKVVELDGRDDYIGGSGLAALLFAKYGLPDEPWDDPRQPLIFTVGPLTGIYPLMSKTVCGFKSPYHDQYAESHAGGRSALSLKFAGYDALVITGKADSPKVLALGARKLELHDAHWLWGMDAFKTGKYVRKMFPGSGHRSVLRIGPGGENGSAIACINADSFRHFGRLGSGGVMGDKKLKAIILLGDGIYD
ncbi:MAG: aldehyde ferredoxin oxidoreductase, partial [Proteobacteria bacterium]|nr:aldehyde ferredoxin oxidoreductase [Pseudomonadota bacterium]MBU1610464.1 aldehyde ferredoxin oxidoreductase [Pseudomonadota bacterium]